MDNAKSVREAVTWTLPATMNIKLPLGAGAVEVNLDDFTKSAAAVVYNGLRQKLQDCTAGADKKFDGWDNMDAATRIATVQEACNDLLAKIIKEGWKIKDSNYGVKLTEAVDIWVRDEAERSVRDSIRKGTAVLNGKKITKQSDSAAVKALRQRLLDSPGWVEKTKARYVPPADDAADYLADPPPAVANAA